SGRPAQPASARLPPASATKAQAREFRRRRRNIAITSPMEWWSRRRNPVGYLSGRGRGPSRSGRVGEFAAQRMRLRGGDRDVDISVDERRAGPEIHDAIVVRAGGKLALVAGG